jgi:hypothetical protein
VIGDSKRHEEKKRDALRRQLWNDLDHLIDIDKLYPSFQVLCIIVPYKLGLFRAPKKGTRALIRLFDHRPAALHAELGLEHPEFPTLQRVVVPARALVGDVELEPGPVESARLAYRFDVGRFEGEEDAQPTKHDFVAELGCDKRQLERGELQEGTEWIGARVNMARSGVVSTKRQRYLVGKRFSVGGYGHAPRFYAELFDAEANVDDLSLTSLGHDHAAQRVIVGEMVSNHRLEKLFWWHVVGRLFVAMERGAERDEEARRERMMSVFWRGGRGARRRRLDGQTCSIQCFPLEVSQSFHFVLDIRLCRIMRRGNICDMIWPACTSVSDVPKQRVEEREEGRCTREMGPCTADSRKDSIEVQSYAILACGEHSLTRL